MSGEPIGLYIAKSGWAIVAFGKRLVGFPPDRYRSKGYEPPYEKLPSEGEYNHTTSQEPNARPRPKR